MKKLLIINSFGPMASTLLAGLMEKFGFTNVPIRKLGLHQYLMGELDLTSGHMEKRLRQSLEAHAALERRGGVSVIDRADQAPRALVDPSKVVDQLEALNAENIQDLYFACRNIYCDAVTYKPMKSNRDWHIEMTVDIHRYDHKALYQAYQDHFDDVRMLHLHRPFDGWINSLASQAFVHPELKHRIKFFPHMRYADYALYEEAVAAMPGMHIPFDDMFDVPIEELSAKIAAFLEVDAPVCNLREEEFDMYGKIVPYDKAFTRFDDNVQFLSPGVKRYMHALAQEQKISKAPYNASCWALYMMDMIKYRARNAV